MQLVDALNTNQIGKMSCNAAFKSPAHLRSLGGI
jgi:hypothetical protein